MNKKKNPLLLNSGGKWHQKEPSFEDIIGCLQKHFLKIYLFGVVDGNLMDFPRSYEEETIMLFPNLVTAIEIVYCSVNLHLYSPQ